MTYLRRFAIFHMDILVTIPVILIVSFFIVLDVKYIYFFSAAAIGLSLVLVARKFPAAPLYLLLVLGVGAPNLSIIYDASWDFRLGKLKILLTDPVYVIVFLSTALAVVWDRGVAAAYWKYLRGGIFLGFAFVALIGLGFTTSGHSALAEFRYQFIGLFIPFYCLSARLSTMEWMRVLRTIFWLSALVTAPLFVIAAMEGAQPFSPGLRYLTAEMHLWLAVSLVLLAVPGLVRRRPGQSLLAWLVGGGYVFLILSDAHRSVWLMLITILTMVLLLNHSEFRKLRIVTVVLGLTLVPLLIFITLEGGTSTADFIASRTAAYFSPSEDPNTRWRLWVWGGAWKIIRENPFTGIGLGGYYDDVWLILTGQTQGVSLHNFYLTLLLKGGMVLTILYAWYVLSIAQAFVAARKTVDPRVRLFASLGLAILTGMLTFQIAYGASSTLLLLTGVLLALVSAGIRESGKDVPTRPV